MTSARRVLVLSPTFHGYADAIGEAIAARGHRVRVHRYDANNGVAAKVRHKLRHELPDRVAGDTGWQAQQRLLTDRALAALRETRPDVVLGIKTDALTPRFWAEAAASGARTHLWLYDELRRMRLDEEVLAMVDVLSSYSAGDTATLTERGLCVSHVANAFDARTPYSPSPSGDILFVGARYPNRESLLLDLYTAGVPVRAVGRDWSHHPVDRARTWDPRRPALPAARDVPRATAYGLMAGAAGNLNVHFDQDGFTMRTFEIPGVGGLQLIDRTDVAAYYDPGAEVLTYSSTDELAELCRRAVADPRWRRAIGDRGRRRTLAEHTFDHRAEQLERLWA